MDLFIDFPVILPIVKVTHLSTGILFLAILCVLLNKDFYGVHGNTAFFSFFLRKILMSFMSLSSLFLFFSSEKLYVDCSYSLEISSSKFSTSAFFFLLCTHQKKFLYDSSVIRTQNHLVRKRTLNHLASSKEFLDIQANYRVWIHSETRT